MQYISVIFKTCILQIINYIISHAYRKINNSITLYCNKMLATEQAFRHEKYWHDTHLVDFPVTVSVNVRRIFGGRISSFNTFDSVASGNPLSSISSSSWQTYHHYFRYSRPINGVISYMNYSSHMVSKTLNNQIPKLLQTLLLLALNNLYFLM